MLPNIYSLVVSYKPLNNKKAFHLQLPKLHILRLINKIGFAIIYQLMQIYENDFSKLSIIFMYISSQFFAQFPNFLQWNQFTICLWFQLITYCVEKTQISLKVTKQIICLHVCVSVDSLVLMYTSIFTVTLCQTED